MGKRVRFIGLTVLALVAVVILAWPSSTERKYPEREPVIFWHMWTAEWKVVVDRIAQRFNESQDRYEVIALSVPAAGADTKFLLGATGGSPPDLMAQWNAVIPTWADNGLLQPLDELMTPSQRGLFEREAYPVVKKVGMYKGRLYGITIGLNMSGCYYRRDHFREAGLDPDKFPTTLEDLVEVGKKLDRFDEDGNLTRIGFLPGGWLSTAPSFGGGFYDWKNNRVLLKTPENLRALKWVVAQRKRLGFQNVVRFQSGLDTGFAGGWPFVGGAYSVAVDGPWRVEEIGNYAKELDYAVAPLPPPKGGVPMAGFSGGNFMVIPKAAKNKAGAWEFTKFWSGLENPGVAAEFYVWGGWLPLSPAVAEAPAYQEYLRKYPEFKKFLDLLPGEKIEAIPPVAYQVFLMDQIRRVEDLAVRGTITPEAALDELERAVAEELKRRKELGYE